MRVFCPVIGAFIMNMTNKGENLFARGKPVIAAGELEVINGKIKYMDNNSGHYRPSGPAAQKATEDAFRKLGFNVDGKYVERSFD